MEGLCDGIDLNLGCPQKIARRGRYGAFLLEERALLRELVGTMHCHAAVPISVKIRLLESGVGETVDLARMLQGAGASLLTVHGRTRLQKGMLSGAADWDAIGAVRRAVSIPVVANGGVDSAEALSRCLATTGCAGVMVAEAALENPAIFEGAPVGARQPALAAELIDIAAAQPAPRRHLKQHLFQMLYAGLHVHTDLRGALDRARSLDEMRSVVRELDARPAGREGPFCSAADGYTSWYRRHDHEHWKRPQLDGRVGCKERAAARDSVECDEEMPWMDPGMFDGAGGESASESRAPT